jgi:HD-GYP domain-containing protein (c-di-GMP phosphodiesterase class II)
MTFPRSYAAQRSVSEAVDELRRCAGTQFDPSVVDALANLIVGLAWPPEPANTHPANPDRVGAAADR